MGCCCFYSVFLLNLWIKTEKNTQQGSYSAVPWQGSFSFDVTTLFLSELSSAGIHRRNSRANSLKVHAI